MRTDYLELHSDVRREICEFDLAQKAYSVFGKCLRINNTGIIQNLLQETYTADCLRLPASRFTITCILAPVPLCAGLCDLFTHLGVDHADKMIQLGRNLVISLLR